MTVRLAGFLVLICLLLLGSLAPAAATPAAEAEAETLLDSHDPAALDRALQLLEQSVSEGSLPAVHKLAMALDQRGGAGDLQRARELLLRHRPAFEAALGADQEQMAHYLRALAFVSYHIGLSKEALDAGRAARAHVVALGKYSLWVAQIDMEIGNYLEDLGQYDDALASMAQALAVIENGHGRNHSRTGSVHNNMAIVYESKSDYGKALKHYNEALRVALRNDGPTAIGVAHLYDNIGGLLDRLGRSEEGLALFEKATPIFISETGPQHPNFGRHLADMATLEANLQRYPEELSHLDQALPLLIAGFGENSKYVASVYFNRANTLGQLGRNEDALQSYSKASEVFAAIYGKDSLDAAMVQVEAAGSLTDMGRSAEALPLYTKALDIYRKSLGDISYRTGLLYNSIGIANVNLKNYAAADEAYQRALAIKIALVGPVHPEAADVMFNRARGLAESGHVDVAIALQVKALAIYTIDRGSNLDPLRKTYLGLAARLKSIGNRRAATIFAKLAVNAHQDLRQRNAALSPALSQSLARSMQPAYDLLVQQQISDGAFSDAQFASTLIKSGELVAFSRGKASGEQTAEARARLSKRETAFLVELSKALAPSVRLGRDIQKLVDRKRAGKLAEKDTARLDRLTADFDQQTSRAGEAARALFASLETTMQSAQQDQLNETALQAAQIQKALKSLGPDVVLYQAIVLDDKLHLFVSAAGRDTVHREVAITRPDLARQVYETLTAVEQRGETAPAKLQALYAVLFQPIAADIDAIHPSVIMLDLSGFLRYVPYAALYSGKHYLVEDYALALYSPAVPTRFAAPARTAASGAGFGVSLGSDDFAPLPGAGRELEEIFSGADNAGPLTGTPLINADFSAASIKTALRRKPQYIHIASHFKFEPGNETRSFLLMGNGSTLSLSEMRGDRDISFKGVDLLTLSACETARGGGSEGEEIESFGALAQAKGASAVMATLWQIADDSTAKLMSDFYSGLIAGGLDKARALQRAQIAMLRGVPAGQVALRGVTAAPDDTAPAASTTTAHPYYWSAFILMGNWL